MVAAGNVQRIRARYAWLDPATAVGPVEVTVTGSRITDLRRARGSTPPVLLLPGLINAHVHLQLQPLAPDAPRDFVPWVRAVMDQRRTATPDADTRRASLALAELVADGVTAVGEIDASGASPAALRRLPVAGRCYRELTGFHLGPPEARRLLDQRPARGSRACPGGWSPHAPYSVSPALFRAAARRHRHLMVHCAETTAEQEFLRDGRGPFAALLAELDRLPPRFRPPGCGAVEYLRGLGALRAGTGLVHCQHLEPGDVRIIAGSGAGIVVCPGTMAFFGRGVPPVPDWLAAGIPVALGTDSIASNTRLSLRAELASAARLWPGLEPEELLAMATVGGAALLGRPGLGRIRPGGRADLIACRVAAAGGRAALAAFVHGECAADTVWLCGAKAAPRVLR